jgi:hypothetical protein
MRILNGVKDGLVLTSVSLFCLLFIVVCEVCRLNPAWREDIERTFGDPYDE